MTYNVILTKQAIKDAHNLKLVGIKHKAESIKKIISINPPPYEKLRGYSDRYSRRINDKHRFVYEINVNTIKIISMWSHYE